MRISAAAGVRFMTTVTLLRASAPLYLAKVWQVGGSIVPTANAKWFQAKEIPIMSLRDILVVIRVIERWPRVALVKEAVAVDANAKRLRRKCQAGIDERTGEHYVAGLRVVARQWLALDLDKLPRPASIDWRDGEALATYARGLLPDVFRNTACVWQFSGSSGHPSKRHEIRMHLFFLLDQAVLPLAWKPTFAHLLCIDQSTFDKAHLIFTSAPVIMTGCDPIGQRHGLLPGSQIINVPPDVIARSAKLERDNSDTVRVVTPIVSAPMPEVAAAFVEIIAKSHVLRSQHKNYRSERGRRLSFCKLIRTTFGIEDEDLLAAAFHETCIGDEDPNADHDIAQALAWARRGSSTGRDFSIRKLCCDAAVALHAAGEKELAARAARLAMVFGKIETRVAQTGEPFQ